MKKSLMISTCAAILGLSSLAAFADDEPTTCSLATLHGTMAYANVTWHSGVPHSGSAMESYDGHGNIKIHQLNSYGLTTAPPLDGTGTYSITASCVATAIYYGDVAHPWTYFVAPAGNLARRSNRVVAIQSGPST